MPTALILPTMHCNWLRGFLKEYSYLFTPDYLRYFSLGFTCKFDSCWRAIYSTSGNGKPLSIKVHSVFPRILSPEKILFESVKCRKFQIVLAIIFPLFNENLNTFLTKQAAETILRKYGMKYGKTQLLRDWKCLDQQTNIRNDILTS